MVRVVLPDVEPEPLFDSSAGQLAEPQQTSSGLIIRQVSFTPLYLTETVTTTAATGTYFSVQGEIEVNEGQPIQPRTSISFTLAGQTPHGAFFEGGHYQTLDAFDPVVTRIITENKN